jgi:hypothetical protein
MRGLCYALVVQLAVVVVAPSQLALAAPPSMTESCTKAAENGQRAWMSGKLRDAQQHFLACSSNCPSVVEADCTKWQSQIREIIPTVVIDARDANGRDIEGEVDVLIDGQLVTHAVDGKGIPVDPGSHVIVVRKDRAQGKETIVAKEGMKARVVTIKVIESSSSSTSSSSSSSPLPSSAFSSSAPSRAAEADASSRGGHTALPWIVFGVGAAFAVGGAIVLVSAPALPSGCSAETKQCGYLDPRIADSPKSSGQREPTSQEKNDLVSRQDTAGRATTLPTVGAILVVGGLVLAAGGLVWHFLEPTGPSSSSAASSSSSSSSSSSASASMRVITPSIAWDFTGLRGRF